MGNFPSGYNEFEIDITDVTNYVDKNVLVAHVDATPKVPMIEGMQYRMLDWHLNTN
jgi:hypothetical protein